MCYCHSYILLQLDIKLLCSLGDFIWGAFEESRRKRLASSCFPSICLSDCPWNNSVPTGRILIKFGIWRFLEKTCLENSSTIKIWQEKRALCTNNYVHLRQYLAQFFWEWEMFHMKVVRLIIIIFFFENRAVYAMWKNPVQAERPPTTICRMRIASWIHKVTNTQPEYVILLFHWNNACTNALRCYGIGTMPILFNFSIGK
jgi:hypothetical protein